MKKSARINLISGIIAAVIVCLILVLVLSGRKEPQPEETTAALETATAAPVTTAPETSTEQETTEAQTEETTKEIIYVDPVIDFNKLWETNKDVVAYLEIPDTAVSYPIMQSSKNQEEDFYLETTFEGYPGLPGSIYIQKVTSKDFSDYNSMIYGHDMADGSFFGSLYHYIEEEYFKEHSTLYIYTPKKQLKFKIIGECTVDDRNLSYAYDMKKAVSNRKFWKDLHNDEPENRFDETYQYQKGDQFVTLSTCIGWRPENRRVIVAVLVEECAVIQTEDAG